MGAGREGKNHFIIMDITTFMQKAVPQFKSNFTDVFFQFIQSDKELMKAYLDTVASVGSLQETNSKIAIMLEKQFSLENTGEKCNAPSSQLIQSYSKLK